MYTVLINARTHVATFTFPVLLHHPQWSEKILKKHSNSYQFSKTIYLKKYLGNVEQEVIKSEVVIQKIFEPLVEHQGSI